MKVTQDKAFQPVTIVIESEEELAALYRAVNDSDFIWSDLSGELYGEALMTMKKADEILGES